jgi:hypothetical protein
MATPQVLGGPINSRLVVPHLSGQTVLDTENALRVLGAGGVAPTFARNSVAFRQDGSQVASGVPRLERGRWHNALTNASFEQGATGWLLGTHASASTVDSPRGGLALKVVFTGTGQRFIRQLVSRTVSR